MTKLVEKLISLQKELKAPKGQYNKFGKYSYRSAEDILEAVKPLNAKHGLLLTLTDDPIAIDGWHYIRATATITDGEENITVTAYAREQENKKGMDHSQITGAASSYARKYALNGLYLIDDTKDADTDGYTEQSNNAPQEYPRKEEATKAELIAKFKAGGATEEEFHKWYAKQTANGHTHNQMSEFLTNLLMKRNKGEGK